MAYTSTSIPRRHAQYSTACKRAARRKFFVKGDPQPSLLRWQQIGQGLNQGDPLADAVAQWFATEGKQIGRPLFQKALEHGLASLTAAELAAAPALQALFTHVEARPEWLDDSLLALGSKVINRSHPVGYYVLRDAALMPGYLSSDLNKPLLMTGALHGGASRRLAQTMKWTADCVADGGLARMGAGFKSTMHVRILHACIRRQLVASSEWDRADMGLPLNQTDMAATWLAFSVVFLLGIRAMGVPVTKAEARGVMHLWRYACWLMGVDAHWLTDDEQAGRALLFQVTATYRKANASSKQLGMALMQEVPQIPYSTLRPIRWRIEQAKHLSVTKFFAGKKGMQQLGLPSWVPPWYPLLSIPVNVSKHTVYKLLPSLRDKAEAHGHTAREELVRLHFGIDMPDLAGFDESKV